ncbi:hypothetical protein HYC85_017968 [Camellia sinensis]|uniref:BHLH domain-containing protein n=1 Tax=Camellia sinensis TaxID=4442 RepID=A0A7J7GVB9_CAMSI|nr:hypothetical protein HYC85_017968 [Camellia sinensis]
MSLYSWKSSNSGFGSNCLGMFENLGGFSENWGGGSMSLSQSLVLDREGGELVKTPPVRVGKKSGASEEKVMAALKSHSEAERRRRERINAHLRHASRPHGQSYIACGSYKPSETTEENCNGIQ